MTNNQALPPAANARAVGSSLKATRMFYVGSALLMLGLVAFGFRHFYFEGKSHPGREIPPPIRTLIIVHGLLMSAWVVLYLIQTCLIASKRVRIHMKLGQLAAVIAVAIFVSGMKLTVESTRYAPTDLIFWGMTMKQFMAVSFFSILLFGAMVSVGILFRRRPAIHRPMMLFATLSALGAAFGRIDFISELYQDTFLVRIFGPFLGVLTFGAILVLARWAQTRTFDKWFAASYGLVLAVFLLTVQIARTNAWDSFASLLLR